MSIPTSPKIVKLNVGGTLYHTSYTTLTAVEPESMLSRMVQQPFELQQIEQGNELFIDRNGALFEHILEYLRNPMGELPSLIPKDHCVLSALRQAEFYLLSGMIQKIDNQLAHIRQPVSLTVGDRVRLRTSLATYAQNAGDLMTTRKLCISWLRTLGLTTNVHVSEAHIQADGGVLSDWHGYVLSVIDNEKCVVKYVFSDPYYLITEGDATVPIGILEKF